MTKIDPMRHIDVFSPSSFGDKRIDLIGVGATGSRIALSLAKLGITNIHAWDFDKVEIHNVANQIYGIEDVGELKVNALQRLVELQTGTTITIHPEKVDGSQQLGSVVFLLTDSMASRQEIWKAGIRYKTKINLMIETRMGSNSGRVYTVNPMAPSHVRAWESSLYSDESAEVSACGTSISVGPTAEIVSGLAVWQLIRWHQMQEKMMKAEPLTDEVENELVFSLQPMMIVGSTFQ